LKAVKDDCVGHLVDVEERDGQVNDLCCMGKTGKQKEKKERSDVNSYFSSICVEQEKGKKEKKQGKAKVRSEREETKSQRERGE